MIKKLGIICVFIVGLIIFCTTSENNTARELLSCFTLNASAQEYQGTCGTNLTWKFDEATGKLTISGSGNKYDTNKPWSAYNNSITSIEIEEGVTSTTNFKNMPNLRTVVLADSVTTITRYTFSNCASLQTVTFGRNLKLIDEFAFNLTSPTAIYYPGTEEEFNTNVTVNDVESSQYDAIFTVLIHEYQTPNAHFDSAYVSTGLKATIYLDGRMVITGSGNQIQQYFYSDEFIHYGYLDKVTSLTFPESVTDILIDLKNFTSLTEITLPSALTHLSLQNIEYTAFYQDLSNWENNLLYIGRYVLRSNGTTVADIKEGTELIANQAFAGTSLTRITIPDSVKIIDRYAFERCKSLSDMVIPDSVTYIGNHAFINCTSLKKIIIPDSVTYVGFLAFTNCTALTEVTYPLSAYLDRLSSTGPFENSENIRKVTVTAGYGTPYEYTGDYYETDKVYFPIAPWYRATEVEVEFAEGIKKIPDKIFSDAIHVKKITIPSTVETIPDTAFYRLNSLEEICVCEQSSHFKVDEYGVLMTKDNKKIIFCPVKKNLTEYDIPQGTEHIARGAFRTHATLKKITLPSSLKTIGEYAFYECKGLEKVIIPDSVYLIAEGAFCYCESINELVLPK
ncbi:MAG: leucine-rich repeat protein, partial [Clostridia bacterium]|nr:leucine-rich repeat protein [Clostridia bacterium]